MFGEGEGGWGVGDDATQELHGTGPGGCRGEGWEKVEATQNHQTRGAK